MRPMWLQRKDASRSERTYQGALRRGGAKVFGVRLRLHLQSPGHPEEPLPEKARRRGDPVRVSSVSQEIQPRELPDEAPDQRAQLQLAKRTLKVPVQQGRGFRGAQAPNHSVWICRPSRGVARGVKFEDCWPGGRTKRGWRGGAGQPRGMDTFRRQSWTLGIVACPSKLCLGARGL